MKNEIVIECEKKKVKLVEDEYGFYLTTMINGFQWHSVPVDEQVLEMIEQVIAEHKAKKESNPNG